jgi:flagellar basal body-associated protein FliL
MRKTTSINSILYILIISIVSVVSVAIILAMIVSVKNNKQLNTQTNTQRYIEKMYGAPYTFTGSIKC